MFVPGEAETARKKLQQLPGRNWRNGSSFYVGTSLMWNRVMISPTLSTIGRTFKAKEVPS